MRTLCFLPLLLVFLSFPFPCLSQKVAYKPKIRWKKYRKYRKYRRYRRKYGKYSYSFIGNKLDFQIKKIVSVKKIEKEKLRLSIKNKLKFVRRCYGEWYYYTKLRKLIPSKPLSKPLDIDFQVHLNGFGRSLRMKRKRSFHQMPSVLQNCFTWFFQGRRFFPPENEKKTWVSITLRVIPILKSKKGGVMGGTSIGPTPLRQVKYKK